MATAQKSFIDGILNEKEEGDSIVFSGRLTVDGVEYVGASTQQTSKYDNVYHRFIGKDKGGVSISAAIFVAKDYTPEDRESKKPYITGKMDYKNENYDLVGWLRERKDKSGEFISVTQSRPRS